MPIKDFCIKFYQATVLSSQFGFDGLFFARLDYQDYDLRKKTKALELMWRGSASLGNLLIGCQKCQSLLFNENDLECSHE